MAQENFRNIRLGLFVAAGTIVIVIALYLIGSKQNMFGSTIRVTAKFYNVNGLTQGNNVRFAGINVGTVESVDIENDTLVAVVMLLKEEVQAYMKNNSIAAVGTDGLMGNKLVNIISSKEPASLVKDGDELLTRRPLDMDDMVKTLASTNENINVISGNLRTITENLQKKNSVLGVLMDTAVADNIRSVVVNLRLMSNQGLMVTGNLKFLSQQMKEGKGTIGALIMDTVLAGRIDQTIVKLSMFSDTAAIISGDISELVRGLKNGQGSLGLLLTDTMVVHNLNKSILSIDTSAVKFSDNMEALKYSWPFKKYYKKNPEKLDKNK